MRTCLLVCVRIMEGEGLSFSVNFACLQNDSVHIKKVTGFFFFFFLTLNRVWSQRFRIQRLHGKCYGSFMEEICKIILLPPFTKMTEKKISLFLYLCSLPVLFIFVHIREQQLSSLAFFANLEPFEEKDAQATKLKFT